MDLKGPCGIFDNHAVSIVGYKLDDEVPSLLIRNSWGSLWGEMGHVRLAL